MNNRFSRFIVVLFILGSLSFISACGAGGGGGTTAGSSNGGNNTSSTTYTLSGTVTGVVQQGVTITLSGAGTVTTTTGAGGTYTFAGLSNGDYTITASLLNYGFSPANQLVSINNANAVAADFVSEQAYSVSGNVANGSAVAIAGVTMTLTGSGLASSLTTTTDGSGNYTFSGIVTNGTYTLTPSKIAYDCPSYAHDWMYGFSPVSLTITINGSDAAGNNFVGTTSTFTGSVLSLCPHPATFPVNTLLGPFAPLF